MQKLILVLVFLCGSLYAADKAEITDFVGDFDKRMQPLYTYIQDKAETHADLAQGYENLEKALEIELDEVYKKLMDCLPGKEQNLLSSSQKQWIVYRDLEFDFIEANWSRENFGKTANLSQAEFRCTIIKNRVIALLNYFQNY